MFDNSIQFLLKWRYFR